MAANFEVSQTPQKALFSVPSGHIVVSSKWQNTTLITALRGAITGIIYEDHMGHVDFRPACDMGVVYGTEADVVNQASIMRRLAKLRKANSFEVLVIAEKTATSKQYYQALQKFVVLELGFKITSVPNQAEGANLLAQMVNSVNHPESNAFLKQRQPGNLDMALLSVLRHIPGVGPVKARQLAEHFKSLEAINAASVQDLSLVVGKSIARKLRAFFDG